MAVSAALKAERARTAELEARLAALEAAAKAPAQVIVADRVFPHPVRCARKTWSNGKPVFHTHTSRSEAMACRVGQTAS